MNTQQQGNQGGSRQKGERRERSKEETRNIPA